MPDDLVDQYRVVPLPAGNGAYIINSSPIAAAEPDVDVTMNISLIRDVYDQPTTFSTAIYASHCKNSSTEFL